MSTAQVHSERRAIRWRPLIRGVAAGVFAAMLIACGAIANATNGALIDPPVALFVVGATLAISVAALGPGATRTAIFGASTLCDSDRSSRITIAAFALLNGVVGTILGFVGVLANLDTPATLGAAASSCLLSSFYGAVLAMLMIARAGPLNGSVSDRTHQSIGESPAILLIAVSVALSVVLLNLVAFLAIWLAIS